MDEWVAARPGMVPLGVWLLALWVDVPKSAMVLLSLSLTYYLTNWSAAAAWSFTSLVCNVCLFHMILLRVCSAVTRVATYLGVHVAEMSVPLLPPVPLVQHSTARALSDGVEGLANGGILMWRSILMFKRPMRSMRVRARARGCGCACLCGGGARVVRNVAAAAAMTTGGRRSRGALCACAPRLRRHDPVLL
jgi:hypothetical protein